jgi:hypothetical protein
MAILRKNIKNWRLSSSPSSKIWKWVNGSGKSLEVYKVWFKNKRGFYTIWRVRLGRHLKQFSTDEMALNYAYRLMARG